ncbi:hypothetical protein WJX84_010173, partial [Apatococcus fuscideae]
MKHQAFVGDVSALHILQVPQLASHILLAGIGSQLQAYDLADGRHLCSCPVLQDGAHIHGLHSCAAAGGAVLTVHGDHFAKVLSVASCKANHGLSFHEVLDFGRQSSWTMDSIIFASAAADAFHAALGLSNNTVLVSLGLRQDAAHLGFDNEEQVPVRFSCSEQLLLYSMALLHQASKKEIWAAAGTVFLDVLIWCFAFENGTQAEVAPAAPLLRLRGHEGSIH